MKVRKIIFLLPLRFPTEKAYGVTTEGTFYSVRNMGIEAQIWCASNHQTSFGSEIYRPIVKNFKESNFRLKEKLSFQLMRFTFICKTIKFLENSPEILAWTRDPILASLILLMKRSTTSILEIHHPLSVFDKFIFKAILKLSPNSIPRLRIFALTERLKDETSSFLNYKISGVIHMAAPDYFREAPIVNESTKKIILGYIGKGISSGHDNQLVNLVQNMIPILTELPNLNLVLVGIEKPIKSQIERLIPAKLLVDLRIRIEAHADHRNVKSELDKMDIGILPYPPTSYNEYRFPIKLVEYGATRTALLICKNDFLVSLVGDNAIYYDANLPESLRTALLSYTNSRQMLEDFKQKSFDWSAPYTYSGRVNLVLGTL